jgi:tetratricopeptide (TPR) repeat protein
LERDEACTLALEFLKRGDALDADAEAIATEAGGHPLFLEELTRHIGFGGSIRDDVKLDDAIWSRILQLDDPTREMAEFVAVAGKPTPQEVVAAAARVGPVDFTRRAAALRASNLVRTSGARWADAIEPYHDRVHEAVLARIEPARKRAIHEALAIAFESSRHRDPETLALHWREAGDMPRAARHATAAGDQAAKTFAFDRAAQWYEQALAIIAPDGVIRRDLHAKLGDALAFAGRGALAASHFEAAAAEAAPMEKLELRRRAADQLLRAGLVDQGLEASLRVARSVGLRFPSSRLATIAAVVFCRLLVTLRGLGFRPRERDQLTAEELARIDTAMMLGYALNFIDPLLGVVFQTRALLMALRAGELERVTRAVSIEVGFSGQGGARTWRRTERLVEYSKELADRSGSIETRVYATGMAAAVQYLAGRYVESVPPFERFLELAQQRSTGLVFEALTARFFFINTLAHLGRYKELRRRHGEWLRDAVSRGDVYSAVMMRSGYANLAWLVEGRPEAAQAQIEGAVADWSKHGFHVAHFYALLARIHVALYRGEHLEADALARELDARGRASTLWRVQSVRLRILQMRAFTALPLLERRLGDEAELLRRIERTSKAIAREGITSSEPLVTLLRAARALHRTSVGEATHLLRTAVGQFEAVGMRSFAEAARDRAARLEGARASADVAQAEAFFVGEGVASPERMIAMLVPGFTRRS